MLVFRPARPADHAGIAALHAASWRDTYRGLLPEEFLGPELEPRLAAHLARKLAGGPPPGVLLVADDGGDGPAGFAALWLREGGAYIDNLHIHPDLRGGGLGRRLLGEALVRLAALGARHAWLEALAGNAGALRFYARLGGRLCPPVTAELLGLVVEEVRVEWDDLATLRAACLG